jgi:hypothetical protein
MGTPLDDDIPALAVAKSRSRLRKSDNRIEHGRTFGHIATFLGRTEAEVREKAAELGLALPALGSDIENVK